MRPAIATMLILSLLGAAPSHADDWPMLGRDHTRNPVSPEKNPPLFWQIEGVPTKYENRRPIEWTTKSKNVKWKAELGVNTYSTPVVADGLVWIGTTHKEPHVKRAGLLKCFRERDGKLLYEYESAMHEDAVDAWTGAPWLGISSTPLVEGDRLWFTSLGAELVCLDIASLKRGDGEPTIVWERDMRKEWGVYPSACIMGPGFTGNVAVHEQLLYAITGNGCSNGGQLPTPRAPSLVCLDKRTGELIWEDNSPGTNILDVQWGSPLVAQIGGRAQVIVPQGDGWIRSFDASTGELIWEFDINPKESKWGVGGSGSRNYFMGAPVFHDGRIYIASGQTPEHGGGPGRLVCIDPTKNGDISSELAVDSQGNPLAQRRIQAVDPEQGERAIANPNSGLIWEYTQWDRDGDGKIDFDETFRRTLGSVAIKDDVLIAADLDGFLHCLDAKTGKVHWAYDMLATVWSSPLIVDDKVFLADEDGDVTIFRLTAEAHEPLRKISFANSIYSSPVFVNGTLYVANRHTLFAIADEDPPVVGGHWPQWRGPNRDNVSTETGLLQQWPEDGPPLVWRVEGLGEGISPVSVTGGRLFTISRQDVETPVRDRRTPRTGINRAPDAVFVPTPDDVVAAMLQLAGVKKQDVVYDLGSGDGRIVIAAAKTYGVQAVGVEIDPELVNLSQRQVTESKLEDLVKISHEDMFQVDLSQTDVVAVFLYPRLLERLRPQFAKMKPGSRIVSHQFLMPDVEPDQEITMESAETGDRHMLYLWTTPLKVASPRPE